MHLKTALLPTLALALVAGQSHAHTRWDAAGITPPRTNADDIKSGPCGEPRTNSPAVLEAGSTVVLKFETTIFHQGDFRIAFSEANDAGFDEHILAEGIPDYAGERYRSEEVTLPDIECDQCTLQLIQVMRDRTPPTNYYSCADIQLVRADSTDTTPPGAVSGLVAMPGDSMAMLSWRNPADADFAGVVLLQDATTVTAAPTNGQMYVPGDSVDSAQVIYSGNADTATASGLSTGDATHFAAYAFDASFNYSQAVSTSVELPEQVPNFAPAVSLVWEQERFHSGVADTSGSAGVVMIRAQVSDDNPGDSHTFTWSSTYPQLQDIDEEDAHFTFDPHGLESGAYEIMVTVTDSGEPAMNSTASVSIEFAPQPRGGSAAGFAWLMLLTLVPMWRRFRSQRSR